MESAIGIGRIPAIGADDVSEYFYLNETGSSLYYVIRLKSDCNLLTVKIERIAIATKIKLGDEIGNFTEIDKYKFFYIEGLYSGIQFRATHVNPFDSTFLGIYASVKNYQFDKPGEFSHNNDTAVFFTDDLTPKQWYLIVFSLEATINVIFESPSLKSPFGTITIPRKSNNQMANYTYWYPSTYNCICWSTCQDDIYFSGTNIQNPGMGDKYNPPTFELKENIITSCLTTHHIHQPTDIILQFQAPFNTLNIEQNITFFSCNTTEIVSGQEVVGETNQVHLYHLKNVSALEGNLIITSVQNGLNWLSADDGSYKWNNLFTENELHISHSTGHGWLFMSYNNKKETNFTGTIIVPSIINLESFPVSTSINLYSTILMWNSIYVGQIQIITKKPVISMLLTFSEAVDALVQRMLSA